MAERRMFTKKITESDAFLDMPPTTQMLYFHLNMSADDDGFVNNPKKIQRMCGAGDDDFKLLLIKNFILSFESGIIVIKHWRMHNYIQSDRYKPTDYIEEKSMLTVKENKAYSMHKYECIQNVSNMDTECIQFVSVGKDRLGKDRLEEDNSTSVSDVIELYSSICKSYPAIKSVSEARKKAIKARLKQYSLDDFRTLFEKAEASAFLKGSNDRNWSATFDWLIKDSNMAKVIDGNYDGKVKNKNSFNNFQQNDYNMDELEKLLGGG